MGENYTTFTGETVSDFLQDNEEYSAFVDALKTANALPLLESYGAYTCFVPNNAAMGTYVKEQGYGSFEHFLDSVEAVKEMVFYHLIDGEANDAGNYETAGFQSGSIDKQNAEYGQTSDYMLTESFDVQPLVTANALDGTIVDRTLGY